MKPAAIAATLLLHTAPLVAVYQIQTTAPATHQGQTLSVEILQGSDARQTQMASREQPVKPSLAATTPALNTQQTSIQHNSVSSHKSTALQTSAISGRKTVSIPADYAASNQKPHYPLLAIKHEEQGTVVLRILVQADGTPGEIRLQHSSGYPLLDESALQAVKQWRFQPATVNQEPIAEWYQLAIPFQLRR